MWLFLAQEILFFGGLFAAYALYHGLYPEAYAAGSAMLDIKLGGINTGVLIGSSLTMALAVHYAALGRKKPLVFFLTSTLVLGAVFLGIKYVEYSHKIHHNHFPGPHFHFDGPNPEKVELFVSLYFAMTGMHALHMIVGAGILIVLIGMAVKDKFSPERYAAVENFGLYWHFVDVVWIFLFPLLYLIGRH